MGGTVSSTTYELGTCVTCGAPRANSAPVCMKCGCTAGTIESHERVRRSNNTFYRHVLVWALIMSVNWTCLGPIVGVLPALATAALATEGKEMGCIMRAGLMTFLALFLLANIAMWLALLQSQ